MQSFKSLVYNLITMNNSTVIKNKILLLFLFLFVFNSCTVTKPTSEYYPRYVHFSVFDFAPFTEQDFLFTPEKYVLDYQSIGLITCVIVPKEELIVTEKNDIKNKLDDIYYATEQENLMTWYSEELEPDEILQIIYEKCIKMGANAFVNFEYQTIHMPSRNTKLARKTNYHIISGFAIKRLN